ncbi:Lipoxygenase [Ascobolus immersus RN42]|uniref:Manganese lipoxygenase n=1 Tax=Ascobolus immersus RN42 TaxID=1160509 RepID=A0A3N4IB65_ASCIM|nr:Lipoxygenase [Ascobolus immersus RN42]
MPSLDFLERPREDDLLQKELPHISDYPLSQFDKGMFSMQLLQLGILEPQEAFHMPIDNLVRGDVQKTVTAYGGNVEKGTFMGTKIALDQMWRLITEAHQNYFTATKREALIPLNIPTIEKKSLYEWEVNDYPPHCKLVPQEADVPAKQIFDIFALAHVRGIVNRAIPDTFSNESITDTVLRLVSDLDDKGFDLLDRTPENAVTIKDVEDFNTKYRRQVFGNGAYDSPNIGDRPDWYTDMVYAEQQFIGVNPTSIEQCPMELIGEFIDEAVKQGREDIANILRRETHNKSLYVQDCRYFRDAISYSFRGKAVPQVSPTDPLEDGTGKYGCASVSLFQLHDDGMLHPLSIVLDYKGSMKDSVTIFNRRTSPTDDSSHEASDWAWRYAKTCAQVSDYLRHQVAVHLVNTHLVEEAIIVATNRCFPPTHPIIRLLQPHWQKTLSINAAGRAVLFPEVITDVVGITEAQAISYVNYTYDNFDFTGSYVPNDLASRGFPISELPTSPKYHTYGYGRSILSTWNILKRFVLATLQVEYESDDHVRADIDVQEWCNELRSPTGGRLSSFPSEFNTIEDLADAITMCIHIASPQHTAVNYLQQYYTTFVISRPASLTAPLPKTLAELQAYKEKDLVEALPLKRTREYLLMSHVPWLLNSDVPDDLTLAHYAVSVYQCKEVRLGNDAGKQTKRSEIGKKFYEDLRELQKEIGKMSEELIKDDEGLRVLGGYSVLDPGKAAVSILI